MVAAVVDHREGRGCAIRYAIGVASCQVGWLLLLALPESARVFGWVVLVPLELFVPIWAERRGATSWHPGHIVERYGLFTIIVLGESVLAASLAVQAALDGGQSLGDLGAVAAGGLLVVFSMWWIYFDLPAEQVVGDARAGFAEQRRGAFIWGYGHLVVFASAAAVGAGIATAVDRASGHADLSDAGAALTVTVPVSVYLLSVWLLHVRYKSRGFVRVGAVPFGVAVILGSSVLPAPVLVTGCVMVVLIVVSMAAAARTVSARGPQSG